MMESIASRCRIRETGEKGVCDDDGRTGRRSLTNEPKGEDGLVFPVDRAGDILQEV
jgi:hypothetical protein